MRLRRTALVGVVLLWMSLMTGCATASGQPGGQGGDLAGSEWMLVSLMDQALIKDTTVSLRFDETAIKGSGGCNTYGGSYTASGDRLTLDGIYWTEMGCSEPEGVMEQEQAYFQALDAVTHYRVEGTRLELRDADGTLVLAFVAATGDASSEPMSPTGAAPAFTMDSTRDTAENCSETQA